LIHFYKRDKIECLMLMFRQSLSVAKGLSNMAGPIAGMIERKLTELFKPSYLEIINESYMHSVPKNSETHFKVVVVSENFVDKKPLARHRLVNDALKEELNSGVHALSINAFTQEQWQKGKQVEKSPNCMGGFGK